MPESFEPLLYDDLPGFTWVCHVCPFKLTWSTELAAQASAVWHVYLEHPQTWQSLVGSERPPQDAKPETLGQLLDPRPGGHHG